MDVLIRYGLSIEEIKNMMDANEEINNVCDKHITDLIDILSQVGCLSDNIKNIFITNPFYLTRNVDEVKKLMAKLVDIGLNNLRLLFDSNPYLLNIDYKEINNIYNAKLKEGLSHEEIVDYFYYESAKMI